MKAGGAVVGQAPTEWPGIAGVPEAVVFPTTTEEVASTMRSAAERGLGVAVVASGARFRGARSIGRRFLVMCTDRLSGTEIYEPADLTLTAKAGTPVAEIGEQLASRGQWLPYDPPRFDDRTLGGLVASGESGPLWMGYGELRNHVLGATIVCGDGRTLRLGGRVVKNVAGFDMLKAVVGSWGRLCVITSVCVRTFPRPAAERVLMLAGESASALAPIARAVGTAPLMPVSCMLLSPPPIPSAGAALLVRLHGAEATVAADQRTLERHCGVSFERAADPAGLLAAARDHAADGALAVGITLLPSRLAEALGAVEKLLRHAPVFVDAYRGSVRAAPAALDAQTAATLRDRIGALGGTVSLRPANGGAELSRVSSRPSAAALQLTARLEKVFDPQGVLWPCRP